MAALDPFGVRKIYPTNTHPNRAKPWLLGKGDWLERRYNGVGDWNDCPISTDSNGDVIINFNTSGNKGRFPVLALRGDQYPVDWVTQLPIYISGTNQSRLRKRGFMGTKNDWKNVEMTLYMKVIDAAEGGGFSFCARGGPHHSDEFLVGVPCAGTCYLSGITVAGIPGHNDFAGVGKELGHPDYAEAKDGNYKDIVTGNIKDKWIGMKGIFYTKANGNPKIEFWLDDDGDTDFGNEPFLELEDDGNWFLQIDPEHDGFIMIIDPLTGDLIPFHGNHCHGETNEQITWGGPGVIFKMNDLTRVDMKWASVREILPPEGWPLRYLLNARGIPAPYSMRALAQEYGLTAPISLRELTELEAERYPFP